MALIKRNPSTEWIVDSGASRSIYVDRNTIVKFQSDPYSYQCQTSDGRTIKSLGKAIARIKLILPEGTKTLDVQCEYMPMGDFNLLSTTQMYKDHKMGWKDWENVFVNPNDERKIMAYAYRKR